MCDLGSRGLGAHTGSQSQLETGAAAGEPNQISIPRNFSLLYPGSRDGFRSFWRARANASGGAPAGRTRRIYSQGKMTTGATQPARLVCHTSLPGDLLAGRGSSPKVPPWCHLPPAPEPRFGAAGASLHPSAGKGSRSARRQRGRQEGRGDGAGEQRSRTCWGCPAL